MGTRGSWLAVLLLAAAAAYAAEVEIITEPRQGEEYVNIQASNSNPAVKETKSVVMSVSMSKSSSSSSQAQRAARQASHHHDGEVIRHIAPHDHSHHDHTGHHHHEHHNHRSHDHEIRYTGPTRVEINPEGSQGTTQRPADSLEKHILENKSKFSAGKKEKKDSRLTKAEAAVEIRDSGIVGIKEHEADSDVPTYKHVTTSSPESAKYEVIGVSGGKQDEGAFDFVDLSDRGALKPSATNQASRISIKKGPNGQDYEYEYVYYYYDDDEDIPDKKEDVKPAVSSTAAPVTTTTKVPPFDDTPQPRPAFQEREPARAVPEVREPTRATYQESPTRGFQETTRATFQEPSRTSFQDTSRAAIPEPSRTSFQENRPAFQEPTRTAYQETPSRGFQESSRHYQDQPPRGFSPEPQREVPSRSFSESTRSPEPAREVPKGSFRAEQPTRVYQDSSRRPHTEEEHDAGHTRTRGGSRFTGASTTQEPLHNEVVPTHTRQRGRGRGQQSEEVVPETVTQRFRGRTQEAEPSTTKTRVPGGERSGVRRPSLELVDSSSFRTHSSENAPPHQDIPSVYSQPQHRGNQPAIRGRLSDDTRESDLPEYIEPRQPRPSPQPVIPVQPIQPVQIQPQVIQPQPVRPVQEVPVQEVPETTAGYVQPAVPSEEVPLEGEMPEKAALDLYALLSAASQESRDNEIDPDLTTLPPTTTTTTTTTTPPPTTQGRGRYRGGSRTRLRPTASSVPRTTAAPAGGDQESAKPVRGRFTPNRAGSSRSRPTTSTTPEPQGDRTTRAPLTRLRTRPRPAVRPTEAPAPASASPASASPAPVRPSRVRPLRPGPRLPTRPEPQPQPVQIEEEQQPIREQEEEPQAPAPEPVPTDSALTRLRNRPRLSVSPRLRPVQQHSLAPRRKIVEEPAPVPIEQEEPEEEPTTPAPAPSEAPVTENRLTSLIRRRRPGQRIAPSN